MGLFRASIDILASRTFYRPRSWQPGTLGLAARPTLQPSSAGRHWLVQDAAPPHPTRPAPPQKMEMTTMRTVLMSGVAALALTFATGSMATAHAQSPAPTMSNPSEAPPTQIAPSMAPPSDAGSAATAPRPDDASTTPPAPVTHRRIAAKTADSDHWAHQPGTGESGPASTKASNIDSADTRSNIAPHLPSPKVGEGASADTLLRAAQSALAAHRTGAAQQALEMAETRLLDRSTAVDEAHQPDQNTQVQQITDARKALASGNTKQARSSIQMALNDQAAAAGDGGGASGGGSSESGASGSAGSGSTGSGAGYSGMGASGSSNAGSMGTGSSASPGSSSNGQGGGAGNQGQSSPGMNTGNTSGSPPTGASGNSNMDNSTNRQGANPGTPK